ncbi:MAG: hypothetical protein COV44_02575 [Deltaproteobacteria bacterium CG11_big_fil_rev_8_21_14_0_20_45_16]|nr:MAG: hypothetical protein COV44_02575 [Deltaproteobacteria bacterium CG11_big_fil_rev_8_21_14_0_20_45_16]
MKNLPLLVLAGSFLLMQFGCVSKSRYSKLEGDLSKERQVSDRLVKDLKLTKAQLQNLEDQRKTEEELIASLKNEIKAGDVSISRLKDRLTVTFIDRLLFDSGKAQIRPEAAEALQKVADILKGTKSKLIMVDGHTDNVPIGPSLLDEFATNWELSTARATSVVRFLAQSEVPQDRMIASGRSEFKPVAPNDTSEGRQENRRIEIVLIPEEITPEGAQRSL